MQLANGGGVMTESKHTQGPWGIYPYSSDYYIHGNIEQHSLLVATLCPIDYGEEDTANANLIAAAPDTLGALENLLDSALEWADVVRCDRDMGWDCNAEPVIVAARAAIAKAKGGKA